MNIDMIAKVSGVLGLLISVSKFVLTRIERRKRLEIKSTKHKFLNSMSL